MTRLQTYLAAHPARGRWVYASVAGLGAAVFMFIYALFLGRGQPSIETFTFTALLAVIGFVSGAICWPRGPRPAARMSGAGALTVLTAFLIFGIGVMIASLLKGNETWSVIFMPVFFLFIGSIFTLFLPYILGIGLSLMFRDPAAQDLPRSREG